MAVVGTDETMSVLADRAPPRRPPRAVELVARTLDLYASHVLPLLVLAAIANVPGVLVRWWLPPAVAELESGVTGAVTLGALIYAFASFDRGEGMSIREALRTGVSRWRGLASVGTAPVLVIAIVLGLVYGLLGLEATLAVAVPGALVLWLISTPVSLGSPGVVLEELGGRDAIDRSRELVARARRTTAAVVAVAAACGVAPYAWLFASAFMVDSEATALAVFGGALVLFGPLVPGLLTVLFLSLRERSGDELPPSAPAGPSRIGRGPVVLGAGLAVLLGAGFVGAGASAAAVVQDMSNRGHVRFGLSPGADVCAVERSSASYPSGSLLFWAAVLRHQPASGDNLAVVLSFNGTTASESSYSATAEVTCLGSSSAIGPLKPGRYTVRISNDGREEAIGTAVIDASAAPAEPRSGSSPSTPPSVAPAETPVAVPSGLMGGYPHEDPELEAVLPASVAGRALERWSVRGRSFYELSGPMGDDELREIERLLAEDGLTLDDVSYAVAGRRSDSDPPYLVTAIRFRGIDASDLPLEATISEDALTGWTTASINRRKVWIGTEDMVAQNEHSRGRPYLYDSGEIRFIIVTDDRAWVADALRQLPPPG